MENKTEEIEMDLNGTKTPSFKESINAYIKDLDALIKISPLIMELVIGKITLESKQLNSFIKNISLKDLKIVEEETIPEAEVVKDSDNSGDLKENIEIEESEAATEKLFIPYDSINKFLELSKKINASILAYRHIPISITISLVSQYDAYLNNLIKTIFHIKPEILNSSERNIKYTELLSFKNLNEATETIIEKEVESVLRENHLNQIKWLENKIGMKLREGIPNLVNFIELTERRNLFVHCNGIVSRQYLEVCKENKVPNIDKLKPGDKLDAKTFYLTKSYYTLFEIGVKLGHVLWRKIQPEMLKDSDENLNEICYDLICAGRFSLAINLLTFATETLKKHSNQDTLCMLNINKALAYYLKGNKNKAQELIKEQDWTATADKFKLAIEVLFENYKTAGEIMLSIGPKSKSVTKNSYREWPLFIRFRETAIFKKNYKKVFKEDFVFKESIPSDLEDIMEEIKLNKEKINNRKKSKEADPNSSNN